MKHLLPTTIAAVVLVGCGDIEIGGRFYETVDLLCLLNIDYGFNELRKKLDDLIITGAIKAMD